MTDFLTRLAARTLGLAPVATPLVPGLFERRSDSSFQDVRFGPNAPPLEPPQTTSEQLEEHTHAVKTGLPTRDNFDPLQTPTPVDNTSDSHEPDQESIHVSGDPGIQQQAGTAAARNPPSNAAGPEDSQESTRSRFADSDDSPVRRRKYRQFESKPDAQVPAEPPPRTAGSRQTAGTEVRTEAGIHLEVRNTSRINDNLKRIHSKSGEADETDRAHRETPQPEARPRSVIGPIPQQAATQRAAGPNLSSISEFEPAKNDDTARPGLVEVEDTRLGPNGSRRSQSKPDVSADFSGVVRDNPAIERTSDLYPGRHSEPDIHVSIGRIEIRAVQSPHKPVNAIGVRRSGPALSLDRYLASRKRNSS